MGKGRRVSVLSDVSVMMCVGVSVIICVGLAL